MEGKEHGQATEKEIQFAFKHEKMSSQLHKKRQKYNKL